MEETTPRKQEKRPRGTPTGHTPQQAQKKAGRSARRSLESSFKVSTNLPSNKWSMQEIKALVEFVLLHCDDKWPNHKLEQFWTSAATFVQERSRSEHLRTGGACRYKVVGYLQQCYSTPKAAEMELFPDHLACTSALSEMILTEVQASPIFLPGVSKEKFIEHFQQLPFPEQLETIGCLYNLYASKHFGLSIPSDFLQLSLKAMNRLKDKQKSNILYGLARGLGELRVDGSDSLIPVSRMPFGLLQYVIDFFQSSKTVKCPDDYRAWLESMYCLFGTKWTKLYNGPMWSCDVTGQDHKHGHMTRNPTEARINVPGLSSRSLQLGIASKELAIGTKIQYSALDEAKKVHPNAHWWIKADGCDIVEGLSESMSKVWSGDVDLADGELQKSYTAYRERLTFVEKIGLPPRNGTKDIISDLQVVKEAISNDLESISTALAKATEQYNELLGSGKGGDKKHYRLGWKIDDLSCLSKNGRKLVVELCSLMDKLKDPLFNLRSSNLPRRLSDTRKDLTTFITGISKHIRSVASHIMVFMISPGKRDSKPYAIPIQCVAYRGMTEANLRKLVNVVIHEMHHRDMKIAGFVTNGEFNSLRTQGYQRPISVLQIKANARMKYSRKGESTLLAMLTPIRKPDGTLGAQISNPAVPQTVLSEILSWRSEGATDMDVITRLRQRTVPSGYDIHSWIQGQTEERVHMLRSILAQMEYSYEVCKWDAVGVPFRTFMYVPETHPITQEPFLEREDEGHVFKRIGTSTRQGGPDNLRLERYVEALEDASSGLTYPALTGQRKQSITDVERLFCSELLEFMKRKNYTVESNYIKVIMDWRRAHDERGLTQLQRCRNNYKLFNYILDELMPWHEKEYDFSLLEVNRNVSSVCGFTRETLIALTTNIEGREFQRRAHATIGYQEHPRASTTDDVECFFSLLRNNLGKDFTLKQVQFEWRKCCIEFMKRMDPSLPFYYFTSSHDRFYEGPRPDFSQPSTTKSKYNPRHQRPRRFELAGSLEKGRATLPVPGARSVRMQFHNVAVDMPPPPSAYKQIHTVEHSY